MGGRERGKKLAEALPGARWQLARSRPGVADESGYFVAVLPEGNEAESTDLAQFEFIAHHDPPTILGLYEAVEASERRASALEGELEGAREALKDVAALLERCYGLVDHYMVVEAEEMRGEYLAVLDAARREGEAGSGRTENL